MVRFVVWDLEGPTIPTVDAALGKMLRRGDSTFSTSLGFMIGKESIFDSMMMLPSVARGPISNHLDQKLAFNGYNITAMGIAQGRGYSIYIETANPTYRKEAGRCTEMEMRLEREGISATVRWEHALGKARKIDGDSPTFIVEDYSMAAVYYAGVKRVPTILVVESYQFVENYVLKGMRSGRLVVTTHEDLPDVVTYMLDRIEGKETKSTNGSNGALPVQLRGSKVPSKSAT